MDEPKSDVPETDGTQTDGTQTDGTQTIDRRTLLGSTLAWAALTLSGCSDHGGPGGTGGGGTGGTGSGGMAGTGGSAYACSNTMTGDHTHPLTIPGADVESGTKDVTYILEDGGTGHTHMLLVSIYDFAYLQSGATDMIASSTTNNHLHTVSITCTKN